MSINTGGGGAIGGGVDTAGGGFAGRDHGAGTASVSVQFGDRPDGEVIEILRRLQTSIFGDLEAGIKGIVRELKLLSEQFAALALQVEQVEKDVSTLKDKTNVRHATAQRERRILYFLTFAVAIILVINLWPILFSWWN